MNKVIQDKLNELNEIIEQYPQDIPIDVLAKFLGWKDSTLRSAIERGNFPGVWYQTCLNGRKVYKVLTIPFYFYYTKAQIN